MDDMSGPIERVKKGKLPIPTPQEIVKDKLKELALEYGWDAVKWGYQKAKEALKPLPKAKKPTKGTAGGGGALVALALVALATKKKRRR